MQPPSSAASPIQQSGNSADELLKGAETAYGHGGPYGGHGFGGHGYGGGHGGHGGGDLAVVVSGGYKVADSPHQHHHHHHGISHERELIFFCCTSDN